MTNLQMLNELSDLKKSTFGRTYPRHGLKLLYWFANECMFLDSNNKMCCRYNPRSALFGFHQFNNRNDKNGMKLLPESNLTYYIVGNLYSKDSNELPDYVREDYNRFICSSNMDRIIVSMDDQNIENVYVTEHSDLKDFNKRATFLISKGLLVVISEMTIEEFLFKSGYSRSELDYSQKKRLSKMQDDRGQRNRLSSRAEEDPGQRISGPQESIVQISGDNEDKFHSDNPPSRCRCVIL